MDDPSSSPHPDDKTDKEKSSSLFVRCQLSELTMTLTRVKILDTPVLAYLSCQEQVRNLQSLSSPPLENTCDHNHHAWDEDYNCIAIHHHGNRTENGNENDNDNATLTKMLR